MKDINENNRRRTFLDTIVNYAVVIKTDVGTVQEIKEYISYLPNVEVVYQKYSFSKLIVKEEE